MATIAIQLSTVTAEFQADDTQSRESLEQAIKFINNAQSAYIRSCDHKSRKISELLINIETLTHENESLRQENKKLLEVITTIRVSLQQYDLREKKLLESEEELKQREVSILTSIKTIESQKILVETEREKLSTLFTREREDFARKNSEYDNKLRDFEIDKDKLTRKITILETEQEVSLRLRQELDEKNRLILKQFEERESQIIIIMKEKSHFEEALSSAQSKLLDLEEELRHVRREIHVEYDFQLSEQQQKESTYISKMKEMQSCIESLQFQLHQSNEKFKASEVSIHEMIRFLHAIRRGRLQLFNDFEEYKTAWKTFFDSNIESLRRQYHVVISTNTEQWVRKDTKLASSVHHLLNELNHMTGAKYPYPQLRTDVPRDIDIEVLLTKLYIPVEQPMAPKTPMAPTVAVGGSYAYQYYSPQQSAGKTKLRRGSVHRPASAGSTRGLADRSRSNNNNISDTNSSILVDTLRAATRSSANEMS